MDDLTDDDLFLDMVDAIVLDALGRIGDDPDARYAIFRRLLAVTREVVEDGSSVEDSPACWSAEYRKGC